MGCVSTKKNTAFAKGPCHEALDAETAFPELTDTFDINASTP
jgi:hypothetical protein